jgi:hypothetical protein
LLYLISALARGSLSFASEREILGLPDRKAAAATAILRFQMIIAQRTLTLGNSGQNIEIPIRIQAPERKDTEWICRFEIGWPEGKAERWGTGNDAIQALFVAMQMIGAEIYASKYHEARRLSWLAPDRGYGFPVTNNIRDLLVGDDKTFL